MKKSLFYLFALICSMGVFTGCSEDDPEVPPTVEDVVAEYSGENLALTVVGAENAEDAKIALAAVGEATDKVAVILYNVVPGVAEFKIPEAAFSVQTKSIYYSTFTGEASDDVAGYTVKVEGNIDEKVMTATVTLTEIEGTEVDMESFFKTMYKGNMNIEVSNLPEPTEMEQRIYLMKPSTYAKGDTSMVKLQIQNFAFMDFDLGDITLDTVPVRKRGEVYAFEAEARKLTLSIGEVTLDLKGTIVGEQMTLGLDIDFTPLTIRVDFNGALTQESTTAKMEDIVVGGETSALVATDKKTSKLTLTLWDDTPADKSLFTLTPTVSENATIDSLVLFINGKSVRKMTEAQIKGTEAIDFSEIGKNGTNDYLKYFLKAQDPNYTGSYLVYVDRLADMALVYDIPSLWSDDKNLQGLASSNDAASLLPIMGVNMPEPGLPVTKASDGAARITTFLTGKDQGSIGGTMVPAITAGTLFTGAFQIDIMNQLKSTKFGLPFRKEPVSFKFTYKYDAGDMYYQETRDGANYAVKQEGKKDECSIAAYLYEVENYDETLDGTNINTSDKVVLRAMLSDGTAKADYQSVEIPFESVNGKAFDASKKYKFAIVCTPSKEGDQFHGGELSSLYIKSMEVVVK